MSFSWIFYECCFIIDIDVVKRKEKVEDIAGFRDKSSNLKRKSNPTDGKLLSFIALYLCARHWAALSINLITHRDFHRWLGNVTSDLPAQIHIFTSPFISAYIMLIALWFESSLRLLISRKCVSMGWMATRRAKAKNAERKRKSILLILYYTRRENERRKSRLLIRNGIQTLIHIEKTKTNIKL